MTHTQPIGDSDNDHVLALVGADGRREIKRFLEQPTATNHMVQFYEDDDALCEQVAQFIGDGLRSGEPSVIIATEMHRAGITHRLARSGVDVSRATALSQLVLLDARETLGTFMVSGAPDWDRFKRAVGGVIEQSRFLRGGGRVRAYGEMVDLLWKDGNREAAIQLEEMWNQLAETHAFTLLCAYILSDFPSSGDLEQFNAVCATHSHVIPSERYSDLDSDDERLREITRLQQRANSLEQEIARRSELEESLRAALARETIARSDAERTVQYNEYFGGMLGHDLRNPLAAICTAAYCIVRGTTDPKVAATRIVSSSERMARMIDQLLDFTRIRVGDGLALRYSAIDLAELCDRIKGEFETAHPGCSIAIVTKGNTVGEWDHDRMMQVFSNLIGNALHHGEQGCEVRIDSDGTRADVISVSVHNHGAVSPEVLPVLFEPFRGTPKTQKTRGLGLGLYITRQIIHAHGGEIEVTSSPSDGTSVHVALPRTPFTGATADEMARDCGE